MFALLPSGGRDVDPIICRRRLGAKDEFEVFLPFIHDPVAQTRPDLQPLLRFHGDCPFFGHECGYSAQDEKELPGQLVKVLLFCSMRGHPFRFYGQLRAIRQIPSVAIIPPGIML